MAKYSKTAQDKVEKAMHEMKHGELKSGKSGQTVKSREQAIAIGLSEARERGAKVPKKAAAKKRATKKAAVKKSAPKKAAPKKAAKKRATAKKSAPKKSTMRKRVTKKTARKKSARKMAKN